MEFSDLDLDTEELRNFITTEKLNIFENEMKTKLEELKKEKNNLKNQYAYCQHKYKKMEKDLNTVVIELKRRKEMEELKYLIDEIKHIDDIELLSDDELLIITTKMDKKDYTKYGHPRYKDFEQICKEVIKIKKRYPKWKLIKMVITAQYDSMPPESFYKYEFIDEYGDYYYK